MGPFMRDIIAQHWLHNAVIVPMMLTVDWIYMRLPRKTNFKISLPSNLGIGPRKQPTLFLGLELSGPRAARPN